MTLVEAEDRWVLPLPGRSVDRLCIDFAVTLMFSGGLELRIEQPFVVQRAGGSEVLLVPDGDPDRLGSVTMLARRTVAEAEAFKDGHLRILFSDGAVRCPRRRRVTQRRKNKQPPPRPWLPV